MAAFSGRAWRHVRSGLRPGFPAAGRFPFPCRNSGFFRQPAPGLTAALALTSRKIGYKYGFADPANGGMDCSGTICHPVTHTMIFLGKAAAEEGSLMAGASVFDFRLPAAGSASRFIGYARIPGLPADRDEG